MANVDSCVRYCERAMCEDIAVYAHKISMITDTHRVNVLKRKNEVEIIKILSGLKSDIQIDIANIYYSNDIHFSNIQFTSDSTNNKEGADIIHTLPSGAEVSIELKFGQKTDRAIGMDKFEKIFGVDYFTQALNRVTRKQWADGYIQEPNDTKQKYKLVSALNKAVTSFNAYYDKINRQLTEQSQAVMEQIIINTTGDGSKDNTHLLKYIVDQESFIGVKRIPTGEGFWVVRPVELLGDGVNRVNVFVYNSITNVQIKYTLNWKNNYKLATGEKVSAKLGLGSPSWNVWIDVEVSALE